ncbi:hypothetical protein [uncultured Desulfuromonas sp.]|uniref:hypothetical protein n=1 Tax=uncultured Desulfuromonas sp. TaxID=181013 RepID=UPI002AABE5BA|nr:hypothetical protein [uncultured Desulfuromonas sp.]
MVDESVIDAFQMMWGKFPEGVMLVDKSRTVLAVNAACATSGLEAGMVCSKLGSPESHRGCLANHALANQKAKFKKISMNGKEFISFWVPVVGQDNIFLHFTVGMTVDYGNCEETIEN